MTLVFECRCLVMAWLVFLSHSHKRYFRIELLPIPNTIPMQSMAMSCIRMFHIAIEEHTKTARPPP